MPSLSTDKFPIGLQGAGDEGDASLRYGFRHSCPRPERYSKTARSARKITITVLGWQQLCSCPSMHHRTINPPYGSPQPIQPNGCIPPSFLIPKPASWYPRETQT